MTVSIYEVPTVIGRAKTEELVRAYSGRRLYVPAHIRQDHPLSLRLGHGHAILLAQAFGRDYIDVPTRHARDISKRNAAIRDEYAAGATQISLADFYRLSVRQIRNIIKGGDTNA